MELIETPIGLAVLGIGALVVLAVLVTLSLRSANEAHEENRLFAEARTLGFHVEEFGAARLRAQLPQLGIPAPYRTNRRWSGRHGAIGFDPFDPGPDDPFRDLTDHPDPAMRFPGSRRPGEVYFPVAWHADETFSIVVFLLPEGAPPHEDGRPRQHDPLVLAVDPRGSPVVAAPAPEVVSALERERGWSVEAQGAWLLVYRTEPTEHESFQAFFEEAMGIVRRVAESAVSTPMS